MTPGTLLERLHRVRRPGSVVAPRRQSALYYSLSRCISDGVGVDALSDNMRATGPAGLAMRHYQGTQGGARFSFYPNPDPRWQHHGSQRGATAPSS